MEYVELKNKNNKKLIELAYRVKFHCVPPEYKIDELLKIYDSGISFKQLLKIISELNNEEGLQTKEDDILLVNKYNDLPHKEFICKIFNNLLGRDPDLDTLKYFIEKINNNYKRIEIIFLIKASDEYLKRSNVAIEDSKSQVELEIIKINDKFSSFDDKEFITALFRELLSRGPDIDSIEYFQDRLRNFSSRKDIIAEIYNSEERKLRESILNKVLLKNDNSLTPYAYRIYKAIQTL